MAVKPTEHEDGGWCAAAAIKRHLRPIVAGAAGALLALALTPSLAAPRAELWERWTANAPSSTTTIDHAAWDTLLGKHVEADAGGVHRFAYARVSAADRALLDGYLERLSKVQISRLGRAEQFAYWINLYNALTVRVVLDHYPVESIRDIRISPGLFSSGPWGKKLIAVEGEQLSLDDVEHRILRPIWRDPRIHYAVNCASIGCPNLMDRAFTASNAEQLLEQAARAYVNHPRGAQIEDDQLVVSSIYEWFKDDFGGSDRGVIDHLRKYASPELERSLRDIGRIADDRYDWSLNDSVTR